MWGPGANQGAYDYSPFPGTSTRQQQNLKDYDKAYSKKASELRKSGYVVHGDNYFKKVPDPNKPGGTKLEKVGKVETGHTNKALTKQEPGKKKTTPPVTPATGLDPNGSNGGRGENRSGVTPVNGSFRTAVKQGPDGNVTPSSGNAGGAQSVDPDGSGYIAPTGGSGDSGGSGGSETRMSVTGLTQYGKTLGGLNQFTKAFTGGYEIADVSKAFKSEDLPTAYKPGSNTVGYSEDTKYDLPAGATPTTLTRGSVGKDSVIPYTDKPTYDSPVKTVGVLGGNPENPQDGTSDKPDVADKIRAVRVARQTEGVNGADFSNDYGDEDSYVSPMYANEKRNKIRSTFLDHEGNSVQAIAAANAVAGYGKDSDGNARFNVGGKLVYAKDGMEYKARNAAMMGENPMPYLEAPSTPDTQPDQPAASEISPSSMSIGATDTKPDFSEKGGTFPGGGTTIRQDPEKYKETQQFLREKMGSNFYGN